MVTINDLKKVLSNESLVTKNILISNISSQRTCRLEELTQEELNALWEQFHPKQKTPAEKLYDLTVEKELRRLRSIILKEATAIGLLEPDNWTKFNNFMLKYGPLKKPLNQYEITEFGELVKQFKSLRSKYEREAKIPQTKAWYHKYKIPMPSGN